MRKRSRVIVHATRAGVRPGVREVEANGGVLELVPLGDALHGTLYWEQPHVFRREWRLVSERGQHLLLHGSGYSRRSLALETPAATWALHRSWGGEVKLADAEDRELARMPHGWLGRTTLELPSGPTLTWRRHWRGDRTLEDAEGLELLRLVRRFAFLRFQTTVTLADTMRRRDDVLELLAVTFFAWLSEPRGHGH